ncbi:MAG: SDR family NAD(P)-dependent oxidoreductase [Candidatus Sumerlaeaceae bacterium]
MEMVNTTALVTGAAKRVGLSIALALARAGSNVILHYHRSHDEAVAAHKQIESLGRRAWLVEANLSDPQDIDRMLAAIAAGCPPVDILVNSASVYYRTPLGEATVAQWDDNVNVNLRAPFLLGKSLGRQMVLRGSGKIVNITDCAIRRPYRDFTPYIVSKAGLMALTESLALELAPHVQVNAVAPGTVLLPDNAPQEQYVQSLQRAPLKKIGSPGDVAAMVVYLVEHGDFMTGGYYSVDGGAGMR